jgi:hypothetical protein
MDLRNIHSNLLDEYILYRQGKFKPNLKGAVQSLLEAKSLIRESPNIPSSGVQIGVGLAKESNKYTGSLIKGIATMHKSNSVPIINDSFHLARYVGKVSRAPQNNPISGIEVLFGHLTYLPERGYCFWNALDSFNYTAGHLLCVAGERVISDQDAHRNVTIWF